MPQTIFVTRNIPKAGLDLLTKQKGFRVVVWPKSDAIPRKALLKKVKGVDAVLSLLTEQIDSEVLDAAGDQLKIVANYAVGYNNIDVVAAQKRGVAVTNTPGVLTDAVAEHAIALMLTVGKRIVEADKFTRQGKYKTWQPMLLLGTEFRGKTFGVIGAGRIGTQAATMAHHAFGMKILYHSPRPNKQLEKELGAKRVSKTQLLKRSDVVSLHVPLLPSTRYLMNDAEFDLMKDSAILINTARGAVVREKALLKALKKKKIRGAGIDVYECEPKIDCDTRDNLALKKMGNVVLTPHIGSATHEARDEMARIAAKNIIAVLKGKKPLTPVDLMQ